MKLLRALLPILATMSLAAQSIAITSPTASATWTGWKDSSFAVQLTSAPSVVRVCYSVDAYPATNAGADIYAVSGNLGALYAAGCSNAAPFSFPVNTFWWADGDAHTVAATAYDALGNVVATSSPVTFKIRNTWPVSCGGAAPQYAMTTSGTSGTMTVTGTVTGACASDSLTLNVYVNGLYRYKAAMSGGTVTIPIDTTQFDNGPAVIASTVIDSTSANIYEGIGAAGEASTTVTLANGSTTPMEVRVESSATGNGGRTLYGGAGGSVTITPHLIMTDESDGTAAFLASGKTFYYGSSNPSVATVTASGATATVNFIQQGPAKIIVMAGETTVTDLMPNFAGNTYWSSATLGVYPDWNKQRMINVQASGGNCVAGNYMIGVGSFTAPSTIYYAANDLNGNYLGGPGFFTVSSGGGPCTGTTGPTRTVWAQVNTAGNPNPPIAHFTNTGQVSTTYNAASSIFVSSLFSGTTENGSQIYPVPIQKSLCLSGYNTTEIGMPGSGSTGWGGTQASLLAQFESDLATPKAQAAGGGCNPYIWLTGANMIRGLPNLYAATQGVTSGRNGSTWTSGATGIATVFQAINAVNAMGGSQAIGMEANDEFGYNATPLGGPVVLGGSSSVQNWLGSPVGTVCGSSTCTVTTSSLAPGNGYQIWMGESPFGIVITGSVQGFNTPTGGPCPVVTGISATSFSFPKPAGVAAGTYNSTNDPGLRIWMQSACQWFTPPGGSSATDFTWDDAMGWLRAQIQTVSPHIAYVPSLAASEGSLFDACLNGNTIYCQQSQTYASIGQTVNVIGDGDNRYWTHEVDCEGYLAARMQTMGYIYDYGCGLEELPYLRALYGYYDPAKPLQTISQGTSTNWDGHAAQGIPIVSCTGNTITLASNPHLENFLPGAARLYVTGNSDSNCNTKLFITAAPTSTTINVALAATTQTFTSQGNNGGTIHFQNGDSFPLYGINAGGPNDCGTGEPCPVQWGSTTLDYSTTTSCAAVGNTSFLRDRGQPFTLTGVTGLGAAYFNSVHGIYDIENLPVPTGANGNTSSCANWWREIPNFSGTGGTAYIVGDNSFIPGRNPWNLMSAGGTTPKGTFLSVVGCVLAVPCSSHRLYQLYRNPNAYNPHAVTGAGFPQYKAAFMNYVGPGSCTGFEWDEVNCTLSPSNPNVNPLQLYSHPNVENGYSAPDFHAGSEVSRLISRLQCFILGATAFDAIDYGPFLESASFQGSCGNLHVVANFSGATQTRTVTLTPYEISGQNAVLWITDATHGIEPLTIINAGTTTYSLTLTAGQAAWFAFPTTYAGFLKQPVVSMNAPAAATHLGMTCGYDQYLLPNAAPTSFSVTGGTVASVTLPADSNVGTLYCQPSWTGSGNVLLSGGPASSSLQF